MPDAASQLLSPKEAAKRIFDVRNPTDEQIAVVLGYLQSGDLHRASEEHWNTTAMSVAELLARQESQRLNSRKNAQTHRAARVGPQGEPLSHFYENLLRDYFLAVVLKRRVDENSKLFKGVVIATQMAILALGVLLIIAMINQALRIPFTPPEHVAVKQWLQGRYEQVEVREINAVPHPPATMLVKFSYRENGRVIQSQLRLTLHGDQVVSVNSTD